MAKYSNLVFAFLTVLFISCQDEEKESDPGQQLGDLYLSKEKPRPGDQVLLRYAAEDSALPVEASMLTIVGDKFYGQDLQLKDSSGIWRGNVKIPDSAAAVAFNFKTGKTWDTNDNQGYIVPLYHDEGTYVSGAQAAKGLYLIGYGKSYYDIEFDKDSALALISADLEKHPELKKQFDRNYIPLIMNEDPEAGQSYLKDRLSHYEGEEDLTEEEYETLIRLYQINKDTRKADSLSTVVIEKFPKSSSAQMAYLKDFRKARNPEEQRQLWKEYQEKIGTDNSIFDYLSRNLALTYARGGDYDEVEEITQKMSPNAAARVYNAIAWEKAEAGKDLQKVEAFSRRSVELTQKELETLAEKPDFLTEKQYRKSKQSELSSFKDTYALVNYKLGNLKEALEIQKSAVGENSSADMNNRYIQYLLANEHYQEAQEKAAAFMKENRAGQEVEEYLREAYVANQGTSKGYEEYLSSIEKAAEDHLRQELQNEMINQVAPDFTLKDLEGKEVSLASLKGKTVILDFWATWCGPCKVSFPGMKQAVLAYQNDPNVAFFFVNTFEDGPTRQEEVSQFLQENDYPFRTLIDEPNTANGFKTAEDYDISGIPTKVIIGPEGNIRFKMLGYDGNNAKMIKEIEIMIDLLNQNKEKLASAY